MTIADELIISESSYFKFAYIYEYLKEIDNKDMANFMEQ